MIASKKSVLLIEGRFPWGLTCGLSFLEHFIVALILPLTSWLFIINFHGKQFSFGHLPPMHQW